MAIQGPAWGGTQDPCRLGDIGYHPNISGTVALWQLNGTLADTSGNARDLALVSGSAVYATLDTFGTSIMGYDFHAAGNDLIAPNVSAFDLPGEMTIEFLYRTRNDIFATTVQTFVQYDTLGYAIYYGNTGWSWADFAINTAFPGPVDIGPRLRLNHLAVRRQSSGGGNFNIDLWINGVKVATLPTTSAATGGGRTRVGGFSGGANNNAMVASVRILDFARADADIVCDYNRTTGAKYGYV